MDPSYALSGQTSQSGHCISRKLLQSQHWENWEIAGDGARFNPFPVPSGGNAPTLYAADGYAAAALESVFHDVPHEANPEFARSRVLLWQYVKLRTKRELRIVMLTNPQLRQLHVSRRKESLREDELIHTPNSQYPRTSAWAKLLYDHIPALDGLAWRSRLGGQGAAYMFIGDRCNSTDFEIVGVPTDLDSAVEYAKITAVATASSIRIIDGR